MTAITTYPGITSPAYDSYRRLPPREATPRGRRAPRSTYTRRRIGAAVAVLGVLVVMGEAGAALGSYALAAPERRPAVISTAGSATRLPASSASTPGASTSSGAASSARSTSGSTRLVTVHTGDTLWSIAQRLDPSADPRPLVDELSAARHGASLQPGEIIRLPK
jgi:hypothetical protein